MASSQPSLADRLTMTNWSQGGNIVMRLVANRSLLVALPTNSPTLIAASFFSGSDHNRSMSEVSDIESPQSESGNSLVLLLVSSALVCLILATIIGNVFVISAVIFERTLRSQTLVLSLAVTDLLVACLVMPLGAINQILQEWRFGTSLCEMWTFIDVTCCTASILHLLAIACDRFWAVTTVDYTHRRKPKLTIALIWLLSALVSSGPIFGWKDDDFERRMENKMCLVSQSISYQIFATVFSFYAPSVLILLLYYRIYQVAKTRIQLKKQRYKYRIRRRPSFYRSRKGSNCGDVREIPAAVCLASHRSSLHQNEYSSSTLPAPSSSGVYSSSTTGTEHTTTTNTTLASDISPNSLSPLTIVLKDTTGQSNESHTDAKRLSIHQFLAFQQHKQSELCEEYAISYCNRHNQEAHQHESYQSKEKEEVDDSAIVIAVPTTNIMVYVDDFGSTVCSSVPHQSILPEESTEEDEPVTADLDTIFRKGDQFDEESSLSRTDNSHSEKTNQNGHTSIEPSDSFTTINVNQARIDTSPHQNRHSGKRSSKKRNSSKSNGKIKRLHFRSKVSQYDSNESKQESKAAKTLTIITGVFIMCWLPFFVLALVMPLCKECQINKYVSDFFLWLGWANSTLNPFLYTIFSPDFRNAFNKFIRHKKRPKKR